MNTRIKHLFMGLTVVLGLSTILLTVPATSAVTVDPLKEVCEGNGNDGTAVCESKGDNVNSIVKNVVNILLYIVGAVSVIVIIISGITFATSSGDSSTITKAKNSLLYAVIGLVVAFIAYAIVNFVLSVF